MLIPDDRRRHYPVPILRVTLYMDLYNAAQITKLDVDGQIGRTNNGINLGVSTASRGFHGGFFLFILSIEVGVLDGCLAGLWCTYFTNYCRPGN